LEFFGKSLRIKQITVAIKVFTEQSNHQIYRLDLPIFFYCEKCVPKYELKFTSTFYGYWLDKNSTTINVLLTFLIMKITGKSDR